MLWLKKLWYDYKWKDGYQFLKGSFVHPGAPRNWDELRYLLNRHDIESGGTPEQRQRMFWAEAKAAQWIRAEEEKRRRKFNKELEKELEEE